MKKKMHVITRVMIIYLIAVAGVVLAVQLITPKNSKQFGARRIVAGQLGNEA